MLHNPFIQKYYQKEPKFNGVYSRNNLPKIKDGAYVINVDEYETIVTNLIELHVIAENATYFDNFGVKHIPKGIRKFIGNKNIPTNIYKIEAFDSIMCRFFCIGFIDFMLKVKILYKFIFP